ncbi:dihydrofolate reductase [Pannonibacter tanglangensis]|uniref:Dihydrofolate reductase n=1 Tax=Pannonibacter tanglangensis TaxID=2750084 RepID=A0ABW9ZHI7_9HYPH|nr:diacylglycerol kinase [Pannonibacter sp. XCT-34]
MVVVAAVAENGIIGAGNAMPWHVPSDLKHFKALTLGRPVVMGRRTFASLGRPLPGRFNIVISRGAPDLPEGVALVPSLDAGLALAAGRPETAEFGEVMVIGGGQIYAQAMPLADRLEITRIHASPQGDTLFPPIDPALWQEVARIPGERGPKDQADFTFLTFDRRSVPVSGTGDRR